MKGNIRVLTYGTFDVLHIGHIRLLQRARALGDYLIVGISTDKFNALKHKEALLPFAQRASVLKSIRYVDKVIREESWEQKRSDIKKYNVDILVMGDDWKGKFSHLRKYCKVVYLSRTRNISTKDLKNMSMRRYL